MNDSIFFLIQALILFIVVQWVARWAYGVGYKKAESDAAAKAAAASASAAPAAPTADVPPEQTRQPQIDLPVAIGNRFTYLGIEMLCTGHTLLLPPFGMPSDGIRAEYVDRDGVLRTAAFVPSDLQALKAELMRGAS